MSRDNLFEEFDGISDYFHSIVFDSIFHEKKEVADNEQREAD